MSSGGGGTTTSSSAPPPQVMADYSQVYNLGNQLISTPQQPYTGSLVAQMTPQQDEAINEVEEAQGSYQPYMASAENDFQSATSPLINTIPTMNSGTLSNLPTSALALNGQSTQGFGNVPTYAPTNSYNPNAVTGYNPTNQFNPSSVPTYSGAAISAMESPYTQQVVQSTEAQLNNQNAQQQQQVEGNAISAGAWGGDRSAVAQALTAGQQQLTEAPEIANLENAGFSNAQSEFNTQQQTTAQVGEQAASLGQSQAQQATADSMQNLSTAASLGQSAASSATSLGLSQASAEASAEQAAAAQQLGLYTGQQTTELGANEANAWLDSQAGFGQAQLGTESLTNDLTAANAEFGSGSQLQGYEQEELNVPYEEYQAAQAAPYQEIGWLGNLAEGLGSGSGGTSSTTSPGASALSQIGGAAVGTAGLLGQTGAFGANGWLTGGASSGGSAAVQSAADMDAAAGFSDDVPAVAAASARGGRLKHRATGGGFGAPPVSSAPPVSGAAPVSAGVPNVNVSVVPTGTGGGRGFGLSPTQPDTSTTGSAGSNTAGEASEALGAAADVAMIASLAFKRGGRMPHFDDGGDVGDDLPLPPDPPPGGPPSDSSSTASAPAAPRGFALPPKTQVDPWEALTTAGFGMMAGRSPQAGVNIGQGALAGIREYNQEKQQAGQTDERNIRAAQAQAEVGLGQDRLAESSRHDKVDEDDAANRLLATVEHNKASEKIEGDRIGLEGQRLQLDAGNMAAEQDFRRQQLGQQAKSEADLNDYRRQDLAARTRPDYAYQGLDPQGNPVYADPHDPLHPVTGPTQFTKPNNGETENDRLGSAAGSIFNSANSNGQQMTAEQARTQALKLRGQGLSAKTALPQPSSQANAVPGTYYQTPKGPMLWTGSGFVPGMPAPGSQ